MSYLSTKKLLVGGLAATVLAFASPASAYAATNAEVLAAAQAGIGYLAENQGDNGSIAGFIGGESDWTTIAVQASGEDATEFENGSGVSLVDYIKTEAPTDATDVARRILAIASIEGDSSAFGGTDYNALLATYHNNDQMGELTFTNDDAFAIMAIKATGDTTLYPIAQDSLNFLLANQALDGSFSGGTCAWCTANSNDTAAAIIAMKAAADIGLTGNLATAQASALAYLLTVQQTDGGFIFSSVYGGPSEGSSTSWSLMGLNAAGVGGEADALEARDWLLANQNDDGGFMYGVGIYPGSEASSTTITADAVLAILGTTWLLDPSPLEAPAAPTPPVDEEPEQPVEEPRVIVVSNTVTTPKPTNTQPAPQVTTTEEPEVLALETSVETPEAAPADDKKDTVAPTAKTSNSPTKYIVYALIALSLIGFGWYMFQPKKS